MRRLDRIPEEKRELMDFAGMRICVPGKNSRLAAIRVANDLQYAQQEVSCRALLQCRPMDEEWKERRKEMRKTVEKGWNPLTHELRDRLLEFGGEDVCILDDEDEDLPNILEYGQLWLGKNSRMMKGEPCQCHANSAALWRANKESTRICTGYALSDDGMWRQHSWLIHFRGRSNEIVETTVRRVAYFGFCMNTKDCFKFAESNW